MFRFSAARQGLTPCISRTTSTTAATASGRVLRQSMPLISAHNPQQGELCADWFEVPRRLDLLRFLLGFAENSNSKTLQANQGLPIDVEGSLQWNHRLLQPANQALFFPSRTFSSTQPKAQLLQVSQRSKKFLEDVYAKNKSKAGPEAKEFDLEECKNMWINEHPNASNVTSFYDSVSDHLAYDEFSLWVGYIDPFLIAQVIHKPETAADDEFNFGFLNTPRDAKVFDLGEGTGLLGRLLREQGFTQIDGADASQKSVECALKSGWYDDVREYWFGRGVDQLPREWLASYDLVMACGVFSQGHVPAEGFDDAIAIVKPGGHFVTSLRARYLEDEDELGFKAKLDELAAAGQIEIVKKWTFMRGNNENPYKFFQEEPYNLIVVRRLA